jgi:hypothetical protein
VRGDGARGGAKVVVLTGQRQSLGVDEAVVTYKGRGQGYGTKAASASAGYRPAAY